MKNIIFTFFGSFVLAFFISACGGSGAPSDTLLPTSITTVEVERGPVYNAKVVDADGNSANSKNGSNIYTFTSSPSYPITVSEGYINIDNNVSKTVLLDINMSSYTKVITPITTILSDSNKTKREALESKLMNDYNLTKEQLYTSPSKANDRNISILTNAIYKKVKEQNSTISAMFNYQFLITDANTTLKNAFNSINNDNNISSEILANSLKLESYLYDTNESLFTKPPNLAIFAKTVLSTDSIESIWNLDFILKKPINYNNVSIGIKIVKHENDGSNDIGEFLYSGISISASTLPTPSRIDIYGVGDTGNGSSYFDNNTNPNNILEGAISFDGNATLTLNLGALMQEQSQVSDSTFKVQTLYDVTVVSSLPIFQNSITTTITVNRKDFASMQGMIGEITIE